MYEIIDINGTTYIKKTVGEMVTIIPINEGNIDYQAYLKSSNEAETK
jgi:hypothetical protein